MLTPERQKLEQLYEDRNAARDELDRHERVVVVVVRGNAKPDREPEPITDAWVERWHELRAAVAAAENALIEYATVLRRTGR